MKFDAADLMERLLAASESELDALDFGVIKLSPDGRVLAFNRYESEAAGLSPERVLGRAFFPEIGPCMNNALVSKRFSSDAELDLQMDYVFTLRLRPEPVRLRLLKSAAAPAMFLLVLRSADAAR